MKQFQIEFETEVIPMYLPDSQAKLAPYSDNGKLPVLIDGNIKIWESLAIFEYLHEKHNIWAKDPAARAHARAISNEMHASFGALRELLTCNFRRAPKKITLPENVQKDVDRIVTLLTEAREKFGKEGVFLYGQFSAADAMYAPIVSRFYAYDIEVPTQIKAYMNVMMALPAWKEWEADAAKEPWHYEFYER